MALNFGQHRAVRGLQNQPVSRVFLQLEPAVAVHRLSDIYKQWLRHGEAAVALQHVHDLLRIVPRGTCVPQRQRSDAVGVDVLRRPLQLGKRCQRVAGLGGLLMVDFQQHRFVRLHDEWSGSNAHAWSLLPLFLGVCLLLFRRQRAEIFTQSTKFTHTGTSTAATRCGCTVKLSPVSSITAEITEGLIMITEIHSLARAPA